ncbi:MAG: hypothetical protein KC454_06730 [Flavobacteriales bacterium]|nr:hypothetical protein [Flavobacteriales bacterium]
MIRLIIFLGLLGISFNSLSQYDGEGENEISRFRPGVMWFYTGMRPAKPGKPNKYDRLIFDITYNDWIGDRDPFKNPPLSLGLNTNLMFDVPLTKGNTIAFGWGISHQIFNIRHDEMLVSDDGSKTTILIPIASTGFSPKKRSLVGNSFSVPLEVRFRKKSWKHLKVHLGGKIGYQLRLTEKTVGKYDGHKVVYRRHGFPNNSKLIYSTHVRFGLRNWALYASYNLNSIFLNKESTQLNLIQFGLSISLF